MVDSTELNDAIEHAIADASSKVTNFDMMQVQVNSAHRKALPIIDALEAVGKRDGSKFRITNVETLPDAVRIWSNVDATGKLPGDPERKAFITVTARGVEAHTQYRKDYDSPPQRGMSDDLPPDYNYDYDQEGNSPSAKPKIGAMQTPYSPKTEAAQAVYELVTLATKQGLVR